MANCTNGKMEYCENEDDSFTNLETEYPAIVFDDTSDAALSWEPTVSPLDNNEIDFEISFDESDDKDYTVDGYDEGIVHSYEQRLETIWGRAALFTSHAWRRLFEIRAPLVRELMLEFFSTCRMSDIEMGLYVANTLCFQLARARHRMTWRQFILALGLHTKEEMVEAGFGAYWSGSERVIPDKGDLRDYWMEISSDRDFLGLAPSYVFIRDPMRRLCHRIIACIIYGRGQAPEKAWVAPGPERQQAATVGVPRATEDALVADQGTQAIPAPVQAHQPPLPAPQHRTMSQRIKRIKEEMCKLQSSIVGLRGVVESYIIEQTKVSTWMISCMT
ncbi:hypothetical protein Tco_0529706 [Tanacetum coccineum]